MLHNHNEMIELNPLVIEHHPIKAPRDAPADEFLDCVWQEMTDRISYLPGIKGKVSYKACFHDYPSGLQTHIYAPLGVDIREKWSIGGNLPGEPPEPRELGVDKPASGLYLREDGNLRCSRMTHSFVLKNLDVAHKVLVERIIKKAERIDEFFMNNRQSVVSPAQGSPNAIGSHMSNSAFIQAAQGSPRPQSGPLSPQMLSPQQDVDPLRAVHPAYRNDNDANRQSYASMLPAYATQNQRQSYSSSDSKQQPPVSPGMPPTTTTKQFVAELPGSTYHNSQNLGPASPYLNNRQSVATELSGSDTFNPNSPSLRNSDGGSVTSDGERGGYRYNPQDFARSAEQYGQQDRRSQVSELASPPMQQNHWQAQQRPLR